MANTNNQTEPLEEPRYITKKSLSRNILIRRLPIALLLIYYLFILFSAWSTSHLWSWTIENGLQWSSGGAGSFFPIPSGPGILTVISPASLIDQVFYLIFMHCGIWIFWTLLGGIKWGLGNTRITTTWSTTSQCCQPNNSSRKWVFLKGVIFRLLLYSLQQPAVL